MVSYIRVKGGALVPLIEGAPNPSNAMPTSGVEYTAVAIQKSAPPPTP